MRTLRILVLSGLCLMGAVPALLAATADDYVKAALKLYSSGDYAHAIPYFDAALKLDPKSLPALQGRAFTYFAQGQYQQAVADCQKYLALNPSNAQVASFAEQAKVKLAAAARRGPVKSPAATTAPASTNSAAPAAQSAAAPSSAAPATEAMEIQSLKEGRIGVMKDFLKAFRKKNQKWPEDLTDLRTFLEDSPAYKQQAWNIWAYLNLTFTENANGGLSVKFSFKHDAGTSDVQFTMDAPK